MRFCADNIQIGTYARYHFTILSSTTLYVFLSIGHVLRLATSTL